MKDVFKEIDDYWSWQKNNEIYLRGRDVEPGTEEYWSIIESARQRYLYYLPDVLAYLEGGIGPVLLEVGCGMGVDLGYFVRNGFEGTGIDLAREHIGLAERYFAHRGLAATLRHMNAERLEFPNERFDCAYSLGVLHHTRDPQRGIDEIHRVLRPGGRCAVMLYHKHSLNNLVHSVFNLPFDNPKEVRPGAKDANFVHRFGKREVRKMFRAFATVTVSSEYIYGAGWEPIYSWTPRPIYRLLSRLAGWHLVILAEK